MAYDDGYYFGQCKLICVAENVSDNGKSVYVTDGTNSWTGLIVSKKATFLLPPRAQYNVKLLSNTDTAQYETNVECGYGECIELHLANGYNVVRQSELNSAVSTLNNTINSTKSSLQTNINTVNTNLTNSINSTKSTLQSNFQAGVDSIYNKCVAKGSTPKSKSLSDVVNGIGGIINNGTLTIVIKKTVVLASSEEEHDPSEHREYGYGKTTITIVIKQGKVTSKTISDEDAIARRNQFGWTYSAWATATIESVTFTPA